MGNIAELISKYGFPIVAAVGLGYFVYYVWTWATKEIKPVLKNANTVLIALIDRIRMLDNDLIRLNQKVNIVLQLRKMEHDELIKKANDFVVEDEKGTVSKPTEDTGNNHKEEPKKK
jgi:F0F1-type ATP synthase membrane subunit b/b'